MTPWHPCARAGGDTVRLLPDDWAAPLELTVTNSATAKRFRLRFDEGLVVRPANASLRSKLLELSREAPYGAFKVENSEWLEWFHEKTHGTYREFQIQHFALITEDTVEVLSVSEPRILEVDTSQVP